MKKHNIIKGFFFTALLFSLLLINVGSPRCEAQPAPSKNTHSKASIAGENRAAKPGDLEPQDDKSLRFREMEWLIRESLMKQYERLVMTEALEDLE